MKFSEHIKIVINCKETGKPGPCKGWKNKPIDKKTSVKSVRKVIKRYASKYNPKITYGNKSDRDSDDRYFDKMFKEVKKADSKVAAMRQKLKDLETAHLADKKRVTDYFSPLLARLQKQEDEAKAKLAAIRAKQKR